MYNSKKYLFIFLLLLANLLACNSKSEKKETSIKTNNISIEKLELQNSILTFFNENETVTEKSYKTLFELIRKDYAQNREKYNIIINIAKKTQKEKNIDFKNKMYNNLKTEYLKLKN